MFQVEQRVYEYIGKMRIGIEANSELLNRIEKNIDEHSSSTSIDARIIIEEKPPLSEIVKDKRFQYQTFRRIEAERHLGWDYYRYATHVRTIWKCDPNEFIVHTFTPNDESGALICLRNLIYNHSRMENMFLVHGSLIEHDGKGVLIIGSMRSGKTSIVIRYLEKPRTVFISDENALLSYENGLLIGYYIPRTIRVRFAQLACTPLKAILEDPEKVDATQYLDNDALQDILNQRAFHVDAGMAISRKQFIKLLGADSKTKTTINSIIVTKYHPTDNTRSNMPRQTAHNYLRAMTRDKKGDIDPCETKDVKNHIPYDWLSAIKCEILQFNSVNNLSEKMLYGR